jgi:carboxymethylenebutenolidase
MLSTRTTSSITTIFDMRRIVLAAFFLGLSALAVQAQDWAKARLEKSLRRHEQVAVKDDNRAIPAFIVYPDAKDKKPVVLLIHDRDGLAEWFQSLADQVAAMGYVAVAPDLTPVLADANQAMARLKAVADFAKKLPASNGTLFVAGVGWGGAQSFRLAADRPDIAGALVFCGASPDKDSIARIKGSVFGFYAANDPGVDATVPPAQAAAKAADVVFEAVTYEGVGPEFMRAGDAPNAKTLDKLTRGYALERMKSVLDMVSLRGY